MEEAEELCHRIAIINRGKIAAVGTPDELKTRYGVDVIELEVERPVDVSKLSPFGEVAAQDGKVLAKTRRAEEMLADVVKAVEGVNSVRVKKTSLDTVFINLTGASIEGEQADLRKIYMRVRWVRR